MALALVDLDGHHAGITGFEGPQAIGVTLRCAERDRFSHAFIVRNAGAAQILECPQYVVVPPGWERDMCPRTARLAIGLDWLGSRRAAEEAALEEIFIAAEP